MFPRTAETEQGTARAVNQYYIAAITEHFRTAKKKGKDTRCGSATRRASEQLHHRRDARRLIADLEKKRGEGAAPLDIVNGPLMAGMGEVGRPLQRHMN